MRLNERLKRLEDSDKPGDGALPTVLPDDATDAELEALRADGVEVYRFSESVGLFV